MKQLEGFDEEKPVKALYEHCVNVYNAMKEASEPETTLVGSNSEDQVEATGHFLYVGHLTQLFAQLQLATPYYTSVMQALKKMGCVEQLRRGGGNSPSRWRLVREPSEETFEIAEKRKRPTNGSLAELQQQVAALIGRVNNLEKAAGIQP